MASISTISELVQYVQDIVKTVNPDTIANQKSTQFNQSKDNMQAFGKVINSAIMEIANPLPLKGNSGVKQVYTTYYLSEDQGQFQLIRHTTPNKSLTTKAIEDEVAIRNDISTAWKKAVEDEAALFQYDRLFNELFDRILKDFQSLGGNTVGLLDKALIRKCKFVRVERGTLSVGYSPLDKKYIVRYNPKFCIDATVEYFVNPVLDESGSYRATRPNESNILYPIMFFLSHEFAHVLYRHVTNSDSSLQSDLPHYVKQYFGDAYINNSIPYMLGADYGRTNSGDQSEIHTAKAHHPIGINEQVPVDNYLKQEYVIEIYKTLQGQDVNLIDNNVLENLKKFLDVASNINVKSSIDDDLSYVDLKDFQDGVNALPVDIKKKIFRSHVKFFTGNFFDIMSRLFPKGYSSNSYMRVLKALLESLFEDIKETETATKKTPPPPPPPQSDDNDSGSDDESGESGDGSDGDGGSGEGQQGDEGGDDNDQTGDDSSNGDPESGDGESQGTDGDSTGDEGGSEQDPGSETGDPSNGDNQRSKYKVGDYVKQVSTGKIGKITKIEDDGTYVIDTSQVLEESMKFFERVQLLLESIIRVGEDDLIPYESSGKGEKESDDESGSEGSGQNPDENQDGSDEGDGSGDEDGSEGQEGSDGDTGEGDGSDSQDGTDGEGNGNQATPDQEGSEGDTGDGEGDGSRDVESQGGDGDDDGPSTGAPTLDQDAMDNSGKDSQDGDGEGGDGDGSPGPDDFPSLPDENSDPNPQPSQSSDQDGMGDGSNNQMDSQGATDGGEQGADKVQSRDDGLDELERQLDEAHEDAKTGMSDTTNDYLEEDDVTRDEADNELDSEDVKDAVSKDIQDVAQKAQEEGKNIDDILKGVDKDEINSTFDIDINKRPRQISTSSWKKMLRQLISVASGYKIERDNARPSRKVEGLWGANKKVPAMKDVVILLDCSASMSSPMFKAIFAELQQLGKMPEFKDTWIHLIPWGGSATYKRYKGLNSATVKQMYQYGKISLGATYIAYGYEMLMKKVRNPDLIIVLTDSEYSDYRKWKQSGKMSSSTWGGDPVDIDKVMSYIKRVSRKTVFVSINPRYSHCNEMLASDYKRRLLDLDPSLSTTGGDDLDD